MRFRDVSFPSEKVALSKHRFKIGELPRRVHSMAAICKEGVAYLVPGCSWVLILADPRPI